MVLNRTYYKQVLGLRLKMPELCKLIEVRIIESVKLTNVNHTDNQFDSQTMSRDIDENDDYLGTVSFRSIRSLTGRSERSVTSVTSLSAAPAPLSFFCSALSRSLADGMHSDTRTLKA